MRTILKSTSIKLTTLTLALTMVCALWSAPVFAHETPPPVGGGDQWVRAECESPDPPKFFVRTIICTLREHSVNVNGETRYITVELRYSSVPENNISGSVFYYSPRAGGRVNVSRTIPLRCKSSVCTSDTPLYLGGEFKLQISVSVAGESARIKLESLK